LYIHHVPSFGAMAVRPDLYVTWSLYWTDINHKQIRTVECQISSN